MKEFSSLAVRIAGLVLVVFTVAKLPVHSMAYTIRPEYGILSYALPSAIPIIIGILLFNFPNTISNAFIRVTPESFNVNKPREILYIGCILIGVVFLFFSISDLIFHLSTISILYFSSKFELSYMTFDYPGLIATIIELLFALILIFKTNKFLSFIVK